MARSSPLASATGGSTRRIFALLLVGVVVREDPKDAACLVEYLETVARKRGGAWARLYEARCFVPTK